MMSTVSQNHSQNNWASGHRLQGIYTDLQLLKISPRAGKVQLAPSKSAKYNSCHLSTYEIGIYS